jgi:outer membrane biosynthesis protein TonB
LLTAQDDRHRLAADPQPGLPDIPYPARDALVHHCRLARHSSAAGPGLDLGRVGASLSKRLLSTSTDATASVSPSTASTASPAARASSTTTSFGGQRSGTTFHRALSASSTRTRSASRFAPARVRLRWLRPSLRSCRPLLTWRSQRCRLDSSPTRLPALPQGIARRPSLHQCVSSLGRQWLTV